MVMALMGSVQDMIRSLSFNRSQRRGPSGYSGYNKEYLDRVRGMKFKGDDISPEQLEVIKKEIRAKKRKERNITALITILITIGLIVGFIFGVTMLFGV